MINNINNKKETKVLVESWRRLLNDEDNVDSQEVLEEGLKQNLALAALAAIALNPFKQTQASPNSNSREAATSEMNSQLKQKGVSDSFVKKEIDEKINQYMKDNVVQSRSYDDTHYHVEKLVDLVKKYSALNSDVEDDPKACVIRIVKLIGKKVQEKSKSYMRGDDPKIDIYDFNQIVKKFERYIVKKSEKVNKDNVKGKKSKDYDKTTFINQELIDQQKAAGNTSL